ncbi:MAG TPA: hypothetical protein V6D17_13775 [Candidatus Obscuribacterales bacterium]
MNKILAAALCSLAVTTSVYLPASAKDIGETAKAVFMVPVKLVSFSAGALVGTPIAVVRMTSKNTVQATKDISGKDANPIKVGFASLLGLPIGVVTGTVEGGYYGMENAAIHTDKPFSKEQFSLGELKD